MDFQDSEGYALVTGGTGGIGSAVCRLLGEQGSKVAFTYFQNEEAAEELEATLDSLETAPFSRPLDLRNADAISSFVDFLEEKGGIHTLVHTVGPQVPQTH